MNVVILLGNLGQDAEVWDVAGSTVANMSVATSEKWTDKKSGEKKESTQWHRLAWWNPPPGVVQYLTKGKTVSVRGKIEYRKYEKDGVTHYGTDIKVEDLRLVGGGGGGGKPDAGAQAPASSDDIPF